MFCVITFFFCFFVLNLAILVSTNEIINFVLKSKGGVKFCVLFHNVSNGLLWSIAVLKKVSDIVIGIYSNSRVMLQNWKIFTIFLLFSRRQFVSSDLYMNLRSIPI